MVCQAMLHLIKLYLNIKYAKPAIVWFLPIYIDCFYVEIIQRAASRLFTFSYYAMITEDAVIHASTLKWTIRKKT